jgi:guanylate kinase
MDLTEKAIIVSAPSGAGKTTIVKHLLKAFPNLAFSVSACSRPKREGEVNGVDYYFVSVDEFTEMIKNEGLLEWEQVYPGSYYGTPKSEITKIWSEGKAVIFDVDVKGGMNLKKYFGEKALSVFIKPPSLKVLKERLENRKTEGLESLHTRLSKATFELGFAEQFDKVIVNDNLETAVAEAKTAVSNFLHADETKK